MTSQQIKDFAVKNLYSGFDFVTSEFGPYHSGIRFDVIGIRRSQRISRVMEVKTSRGDFLADKKWQKYLQFATHFYFICPVGIIKPSELDPRIGLIELTEVGHGYFRYTFTKKCRRLPDLKIEAYLALVEAVAFREWGSRKTG